MFGIRELKERVAKLEKELGEKTKSLESAMDYQDKVAEFLLKHDRNEIVLDYTRMWGCKQHRITYTYNGKLRIANLENLCDILALESVEEINSFTNIIKIKELYDNRDEIVTKYSYYQLDKIDNTLIDITETRKKLVESQKKPSETKSKKVVK